MKKSISALFIVGVLALLVVLIKNFDLSSNNTANSSSDSVNVETENPAETSIVYKLDLSNKNLEKLPSNVLTKTSLVELDISNNNLTGALPAEIRNLKNLKVLNASNNNMTGVPAEIGQLEKLEVLNLANNQLTGLPYELGNLKNLKKLDLSGNNYSTQDLEKIKQGLPADIEIVY